MFRVAANAALCIVAMLLSGAAPTAKPPQSLAGRYYRQFPDGLVTGKRYTGEDVVEIVPVTASAAYVRTSLDFYNGHSCSLAGVARSQGAMLVYRSPEPDDPCVLSVSRVGRSLRLDDNGGTCKGHCGERGSFGDVRLPWSSKRPIRYLARLKASRQYRASLVEWRGDSK